MEAKPSNGLVALVKTSARLRSSGYIPFECSFSLTPACILWTLLLFQYSLVAGYHTFNCRFRKTFNFIRCKINIAFPLLFKLVSSKNLMHSVFWWQSDIISTALFTFRRLLRTTFTLVVAVVATVEVNCSGCSSCPFSVLKYNISVASIDVRGKCCAFLIPIFATVDTARNIEVHVTAVH